MQQDFSVEVTRTVSLAGDYAAVSYRAELVEGESPRERYYGVVLVAPANADPKNEIRRDLTSQVLRYRTLEKENISVTVNA